MPEPSDIPALLAQAAKFARPPVSNFFVGAVARGTSTGKLYFGANLEFAGEALGFTVHAEQAAVTNAWVHGEQGVDLIAVTAPPCGYCRQFLNELVTAGELQISINGEEQHPLSHFLPRAFGPRDLGVDGGLMAPMDHPLALDESDELAQAAFRAAKMSYAPYSRSYAGVALRTGGGRIVFGPYAENAAFNPSMEPLEVALSALNLAGGDFGDIAEAVLVETEGGMHESAARTVLATVSRVPLRVVRARIV
jgi:cytidine deaminase